MCCRSAEGAAAKKTGSTHYASSRSIVLQAGLPGFSSKGLAAPRCFAPFGASLVDGGAGGTRAGDRRRASEQLQDVHPRAVAVDDVDQAAIVDLDVVGHVVAIGRVGVGFRNVERHLRRGVRLPNVPDAHAAVEPRDRRQLAVERVVEVLLGGVGAEAYAASAIVSARVSFAELRLDEQCREPHRTLVAGIWVVLDASA